MPQITTKSGRTLYDVLNDECHDRGQITRRGDSIVPPVIMQPEALREVQRTMDNARLIEQADRKGLSPQAYAEQLRSAFDFLAPLRAMRESAHSETIVPASHRADPHTSSQAARSMAQGAQRHRVAIMTALRLFGPATGHELAARLGMEYVQVAKRLTELAADGRINRRETGTIGGKPAYQTRNSPSGRAACVWHINPLSK